MMDHHGTAAQQAQLERMASRRASLGMLASACAPSLLVLGYFLERRHSSFAVTISALVAAEV